MFLKNDLINIIGADLSRDSHKEALVRLIDAYMRDEMGARKPLDIELEGDIVAGLRSNPCVFILFADYDGEIVGMTVCFLGFSTFSGRNIINVHDLIVLSQYRKNGIARMLLKAVEDKARSLDCCKITLEVRADNLKAMSLYRQAGFSMGDYPMYFWTKII